MRVKSLVAAAGIAVAAAVMVVPGVSSASWGGGGEPTVQPNVQEPVEETPAPAPTAPAEEEVTSTPVEEETPTAPVVGEPVPVAAKAKPSPVPAPPTAEEPPSSEPVERVPVIDVPAPVLPQEAPAPKADKRQGPKDDSAKAEKEKEKEKEKGRCHMGSYVAVERAALTNADEAARAEKVDRNGNGTVCRKEIPGPGKGNTGQNSNIKDDQA